MTLSPKPLFVLVLTLLALELAAQQDARDAIEVATVEDQALREAVVEVELLARSQYRVGSDLDGPSESIDTWSNRLDLRLSGPLWRGAFVDLGLGYEHQEYDFEGRNDFFVGSNDPWRSVNSASLRLSLLQALGDDWGALLYFEGRAAAEKGAALDDGLSALTMLGIGHQCTPDFRAGLGLALLARFEEDLLVFPGFYLDWRIDEAWRFSLFGPRASLEFKADEAWSFNLSCGFDGRRFRLSDQGSKNDGIVQEFRVPLVLEARWRGLEKLELAVSIGVDLYREYRLSDRDGRNDRVWEAAPGLIVGLSAQYRF
ncbi:MAG: hypothetical protein H6807_06700 [Planctomycetes bacterium]|nr:hypothetical protein [Planctomycetota bacterium]